MAGAVLGGGAEGLTAYCLLQAPALQTALAPTPGQAELFLTDSTHSTLKHPARQVVLLSAFSKPKTEGESMHSVDPVVFI